MKVIFLDIDGVLNTIDTFKRRKDIYNNYGVIIPRIDFYRVKFLKEIIDKTDAKIIISSTWRKYDNDMKELKHVFSLFDLEVYDVTCIDISGKKGIEINDWLNKNEVDSFVIIDDETSDMIHLEKYVVKTRENFKATGLLEKHVDVAINILNNSKKLVLNNKDNNE